MTRITVIDKRTGKPLTRETVAERFEGKLPNVHPADELSGIRGEIKVLQERADELRDQLLADGADLNGDMYTASVVPGVRETLDKKALIEAFGEKAIFPFIKRTSFKTVKLSEK